MRQHTSVNKQKLNFVYPYTKTYLCNTTTTEDKAPQNTMIWCSNEGLLAKTNKEFNFVYIKTIDRDTFQH